MTAVVVGGSSGLGRALCEALAAHGRDVVIVASAIEDCRRLADHLHLRYGVTACPLAIDARDPARFGAQLARDLDGLDPITELFVPIGLAFDDDQVGEAHSRFEQLWRVNYAAVVSAIEALLPRLAPDGARIAGFGSIAAIRARNRNVQYAAAKSALRTYFEGLRHALAATPHTAQFYVVGYIASGQSFGKTQLFPPMTAEAAARRILRDGTRDFGRRFLPRYWALVAAMLRLMPWRIFSRLSF